MKKIALLFLCAIASVQVIAMEEEYFLSYEEEPLSEDANGRKRAQPDESEEYKEATEKKMKPNGEPKGEGGVIGLFRKWLGKKKEVPIDVEEKFFQDITSGNYKEVAAALGGVFHGNKFWRISNQPVLVDLNNAIDKAGMYTPLMTAVINNDKKMVQLLLHAGADSAGTPTKENLLFVTPTALHMAENNPEIIKMLIKAGADIDAQNINGDTPLMEAIRWLKVDKAKALIDAGANTTHTNKEGATALSIAKKQGLKEIITILELKEFLGQSPIWTPNWESLTPES